MKYAFIFCLALVVTACGGNKDLSPGEVIAGTDSKIWKARTEYSASGDNVELSEEDKNESMRFYANGTFSMQSNANMANGTWSYDEAASTLKLVFEGDDFSENFKVSDMSADKMTLIAGDGSKMILQQE